MIIWLPLCCAAKVTALMLVTIAPPFTPLPSMRSTLPAPNPGMARVWLARFHSDVVVAPPPTTSAVSLLPLPAAIFAALVVQSWAPFVRVKVWLFAADPPTSNVVKLVRIMLLAVIELPKTPKPTFNALEPFPFHTPLARIRILLALPEPPFMLMAPCPKIFPPFTTTILFPTSVAAVPSEIPFIFVKTVLSAVITLLLPTPVVTSDKDPLLKFQKLLVR